MAYGLTSMLRGGRLASGGSGRRHRFRGLPLYWVLHRGELAPPRPEAGRDLQHPVADAAEAGGVS